MRFGSFTKKSRGRNNGPAGWKPWAVWDANRNTTIATGVSEWADSVKGYRFEQTTGADQPVVNQSSLFNHNKRLDFDGSDYLVANTTDLPLTEQRFFHDNSTSWFIACVFTSETTTGDIPLIVTNNGGLTAGLNVFIRGSDKFVRATIYGDGTSLGFVQTANNTISTDSEHILFVQYDSISEQIAISVDGGNFVKGNITGTRETGDPAGILSLMSTSSGGTSHLGKISHLSIFKEIPSIETKRDILEYYLHRYSKALTPSECKLYLDGDPENVTLVSGKADVWNDQSPEANNLSAPTSTNRAVYNSSDPDFNHHGSLEGATDVYLTREAFTGGQLAQPYTKYWVIKTNTSGTAHFFGHGDSAGSLRGDDTYTAGGNFGMYATATQLTGPTGKNGAFYIGRSIYDAGNSRLLVYSTTDKLKEGTGTVGTSDLDGATVLGFRNNSSHMIGGKMAFACIAPGRVEGLRDARIRRDLERKYLIKDGSVHDILGDSLALWHRGDIYEPSGSITGDLLWTDLSGNGAHTGSHSVAASPVPVTGALGLPALRFDGTRIMFSEQPVDKWRFLHDGSTKAVVWAVIKFNNAGSDGFAIATSNTSQSGVRLYHEFSTSRILYRIANGTTNIGLIASNNFDAMLFVSEFDTTGDWAAESVTYKEDGSVTKQSAALPSAPSTSDSQFNFRIGGSTSANLDGDIYEIIIAKDPTPTQITRIGFKLRNYYNLK